MAASWKYFALRTLNVILTVVIIAIILSSFFTTLKYEDQKESIEGQVKNEVQLQHFESPEEARKYREDRLQELRKENNLDESKGKRIFYNAVDLMTFNFGTTHRFSTSVGGEGRQISNIIMDYLPNTILLLTSAALIYTFLAIFLGLKAAQKTGSKLDKFVTLLSASLSSVPVWWAGMISLVIFSSILGWYPTPQPYFPNVENLGYLGYVKEILIKLSLPLFTIVLVKFGGRLWMSRSIVSGILEDDYIMAARAKGLPEKKVVYGHALKTAAPPITTTAMLALLTSLGGALIAEVIFQWPGIGYLLRRSLYESSRSFTAQGSSVFEDQLIISITYVLVVISMIGLYIGDIIFGILDPRVELGSEFKEGK